MCLVEDDRRPRSSEQTPPMPMAFAHSPASRSGGAAERHLTVAVGFSPRTTGKTERRRVATFDPAIGPAIHRSCVATRRPPALQRDRGLKPTATGVSSLRDENPPDDLIRCSCADRSLVRHALPSKVLAREFRLVLSDQKRLENSRKPIDR